MALYLKYRPQKIDQLDLETVRDGLTEILGAKEIPHAFLFSGPKGTGKTSAARILSKVVNCKRKKKDGEPCNKCESCKLIAKGTSMDIIEIDAASNRGIDDIRELRDKIKLSPSSLDYKVYIIDEVHMLTKEAFNALLKTLEEPPKHAKLVLCTTEIHKIPGTIVSRCFGMKFNKAAKEEMVRSLKKVVKGEKLVIKDEDLEKISKRADGSFRDGVKILEQLAVKSKKITGKRVSQILERGMGDRSLDEWLLWVYEGEAKKALDWLSKIMNEGASVGQLILEAIERLRGLMLKRAGVEWEAEEIKEIDDDEKMRQMIYKLIQAARDVKGSVVESLGLELMIAEWAEIKQGEDEEKHEPKSPEAGKKEVKKEPKEKSIKASQMTSKAGKLELDEVMRKWVEVLAAIRPLNHSLEALLRATKPVGFEGDWLILEVFYKFHKERLEVERYRQLVEEVASKVLVAPIRVKYYLSQGTQKVVKEAKKDDNISTEVEDDIVKSAEEIFGVKID